MKNNNFNNIKENKKDFGFNNFTNQNLNSPCEFDNSCDTLFYNSLININETLNDNLDVLENDLNLNDLNYKFENSNNNNNKIFDDNTNSKNKILNNNNSIIFNNKNSEYGKYINNTVKNVIKNNNISYNLIHNKNSKNYSYFKTKQLNKSDLIEDNKILKINNNQSLSNSNIVKNKSFLFNSPVKNLNKKRSVSYFNVIDLNNIYYNNKKTLLNESIISILNNSISEKSSTQYKKVKKYIKSNSLSPSKLKTFRKPSKYNHLNKETYTKYCRSNTLKQKIHNNSTYENLQEIIEIKDIVNYKDKYFKLLKYNKLMTLRFEVLIQEFNNNYKKEIQLKIDILESENNNLSKKNSYLIKEINEIKNKLFQIIEDKNSKILNLEASICELKKENNNLLNILNSKLKEIFDKFVSSLKNTYIEREKEIINISRNYKDIISLYSNQINEKDKKYAENINSNKIIEYQNHINEICKYNIENISKIKKLSNELADVKDNNLNKQFIFSNYDSTFNKYNESLNKVSLLCPKLDLIYTKILKFTDGYNLKIDMLNNIYLNTLKYTDKLYTMCIDNSNIKKIFLLFEEENNILYKKIQNINKIINEYINNIRNSDNLKKISFNKIQLIDANENNFHNSIEENLTKQNNNTNNNLLNLKISTISNNDVKSNSKNSTKINCLNNNNIESNNYNKLHIQKKYKNVKLNIRSNKSTTFNKLCNKINEQKNSNIRKNSFNNLRKMSPVFNKSCYSMESSLAKFTPSLVIEDFKNKLEDYETKYSSNIKSKIFCLNSKHDDLILSPSNDKKFIKLNKSQHRKNNYRTFSNNTKCVIKNNSKLNAKTINNTKKLSSDILYSKTNCLDNKINKDNSFLTYNSLLILLNYKLELLEANQENFKKFKNNSINIFKNTILTKNTIIDTLTNKLIEYESYNKNSLYAFINTYKFEIIEFKNAFLNLKEIKELIVDLKNSINNMTKIYSKFKNEELNFIKEELKIKDKSLLEVKVNYQSQIQNLRHIINNNNNLKDSYILVEKLNSNKISDIRVLEKEKAKFENLNLSLTNIIENNESYCELINNSINDLTNILSSNINLIVNNYQMNIDLLNKEILKMSNDYKTDIVSIEQKYKIEKEKINYEAIKKVEFLDKELKIYKNKDIANIKYIKEIKDYLAKLKHIN